LDLCSVTSVREEGVREMLFNGKTEKESKRSAIEKYQTRLNGKPWMKWVQF